jgi:GTP:adenosylcobinamide-phosphate guanylyltransferase
MWFLVNYIQDLRRFIEVYTSSFFMIKMDMVVILKNVIIIIFEQYMFNHLQPFPNICENLYLMSVMSFFNWEVLKENPQSP